MMDLNLPQRFHRLVESDPTAVAYSFRDAAGRRSVFDRQTLWENACGIANACLPLQPGGHVMLVMPIGLRLLAGHLAAQMLGCAASIFTHPSPKLAHDVYAKNLRNALGLMHPDVVITVREFEPDVRLALRDSTSRVLIAEELPERDACTTDAWKSRATTEIAVIQYSSGSTGLQKGVTLTHEMIQRQSDSYAAFIGLRPASDAVCGWLPLYHDMGLFTSFLMPMLTGIPAHLLDPFAWIQDPLILLRLISEERGTLCWQPNFAYNIIASRAADLAPGSFDLSSMRGFTNCSEPAYPQTIKTFRAALEPQGLDPTAMWVCYAMAENAFAVTGSGQSSAPLRELAIDPGAYSRNQVVAVENAVGIPLVSCGVPIDGCEVRIVHPETRANTSAAEVGEVAIHSPFLFQEYLNNTDATAASLDTLGWYYTGDLGFLHDGHLYISGRKKDLIIVAGRNFYPQDIEKAAASCDGAIPGRIAALGDRDPDAGTERVVIVVESRLTDEAALRALSAEVRKRVFEELDCPVTDVAVVPHMWLQKTSSGKLSRGQNLERYRELRAKRKQHTHAAKSVREASIMGTMAWAAATALAIQLWLLLYVVEQTSGWNVYAGF